MLSFYEYCFVNYANILSTYSNQLIGIIVPIKAMRLARVVKAILESEELRVLVKTYNIYFEEYSNNIKKKVMHVVPNVVWKKVYVIYLLAYMDNLLLGETLKEL